MRDVDKLRDYYFQVKLDYGMSLEAESEAEAREIIKNIFEEDHHIILKDNEIILEGE